MTIDTTVNAELQSAAEISRNAARADFRDAAQNIGHTISLAWFDIRLRYQRTLLGPMWITLSTAVFVVSLGILYSQIFKATIDSYLPYLAAGFMVWNLMSLTLIEAPGIFVSMGGVINSIKVPFASHIVRQIARNVIIFLHTLIVILAVEVYVGLKPGPALLLTIPGLAILILNLYWMSLAAGILGARYRDIGHVLTSILQLMFFLTPIIWQRNALNMGESSIWVEGNPFYHLVNIVRAPMLSQYPSATNYAVCISLAIAGWIMTYFLFLKYRRRIAYWV